VANPYLKDDKGNYVHPDYENDSTNFNPRDTRFGVRAAHKEGNWLVKGRFEIDFYGDANGNNLIPRMRLGYAKLINVATKTSVLIGQDWIPVAQLNPSTVDFGILTAAGNLWWRVPQITVRQEVGGLEFLVSAMKHRRKDDAWGRKDSMPWLLGRVAYKGGLSGVKYMFALGGGYRDAEYGEVIKDATRYLVVGEWKLSVSDALLFKGEAWWGKGIGECFLRYDLDASTDGSPAEAQGVWADLTYKFTRKWSATVGFGIDDPIDKLAKEDLNKDSSSPKPDRQFTKNTQIFANVWYQFMKPLKFGVEFIHIETERSDETRAGDRYTFSMQYVF
jgi:hypothetical protein